MKKILFMFLCLNLIHPLHAQSSYSGANQDNEANIQLKNENDPNHLNRDVNSESSLDPHNDDPDQKLRELDQNFDEPENISEEDEHY